MTNMPRVSTRFSKVWIRLLSPDGSDKKADSSRLTLFSLLAIWLKSSPKPMGMPSSSLSSFSSVIGLCAGCSFRLAQIVSAWMPMKSLLMMWPDTGWYFVYF